MKGEERTKSPQKRDMAASCGVQEELETLSSAGDVGAERASDGGDHWRRWVSRLPTGRGRNNCAIDDNAWIV